ASDPERSRRFLEQTLGFEPGFEVNGDHRQGSYIYDAPPEKSGAGGAGTVHHVAFASTPDDHPAWRARVAESGAQPTPIIDRFYFRSVYFREPSGVLLEIATIGPGFTSDEPLESLGERLSLPPDFESLRERLEGVLTPLPSPRRET
ncbi:MAG: VOC family protein, partial [Gaiellaceae bacterium]